MFGFNYGVAGVSGSGALWANWDGSQDGSNIDTTLTSNASINSPVVIRMSDTKIALFATDTSANLYVTIGTLSGTTITWDNVNRLLVDTTLTPAGGLCAGLLDTDKLIVFYYAGTQVRSRVITVSTTTPSGGTVEVISANNALDAQCSALTILSTTTAFVIYRMSAGGDNGKIGGVILSVSGSTITENTEAFVITNSTPTLYNAAYYTSGKIIITYRANATSYPSAKIINYSGTTIGAIGTAAVIESVVNESNSLSCAPMSASTAIVTFGNFDGSTIRLRGVLLSLSSDTVTVNTIITVNTDRASHNYVVALNGTEAMVAYHKSGVDTNVFAKVITVSATSLSAGSEVTIQAINEKGGTPYLAKIDTNYVAEAVTTASSKASGKILKRV